MIANQNNTCIASKVEHADTFFKQALGLMFRFRIEQDYALMFRFKEERTVDIHMLFVPFDIVVVLLDGHDIVTRIVNLKAWSGRMKAHGVKTILEMNHANEVKVGDKLHNMVIGNKRYLY